MEPPDDLEPALEEDIRFAERTEKAYLEFEKGEYIRENDVDFLQKLKLW